MGSVRLIRSRQIRQETAPEEEEERKDWILASSMEEGDDDDDDDVWQSRYALKMELDRSLWRCC